MFSAPFTVLFEFQLTLYLLHVFMRVVADSFAYSALQFYQIFRKFRLRHSRPILTNLPKTRKILLIIESRDRDLNPGPFPYQGSALPLSYLGM